MNTETTNTLNKYKTTEALKHSNAPSIKTTDKKYINHFESYKNRKWLDDFINVLPKLIEKNSIDHIVYFATFTFKELKALPNFPDHQYIFDEITMRIDSGLQKGQNKKSIAKFILIPEKSPAEIKRTQGSVHYHGFLLIQKSHHAQFMKKFYSHDSIEIKRHKKTGKTYINKAVFIKEKIAFPKCCPIKQDGYRLYENATFEEFENITGYSAKSLLDGSFKYEDIIIPLRNYK